MSSSKLTLATALGLVLGAHAASAGGGIGDTVTYSKNNDTAFSVGVQYDFGDMQPELVGSVRHTVTDTENDVTGGKVDLSIPLTGDNHMPTMRAMGVAGSTDVQGEFGLGYDFGSAQALVAGGAQGPYVNGGINYQLDGKFAPYIGVNTLKDAPDANSTILPPP